MKWQPCLPITYPSVLRNQHLKHKSLNSGTTLKQVKFYKVAPPPPLLKPFTSKYMYYDFELAMIHIAMPS